MGLYKKKIINLDNGTVLKPHTFMFVVAAMLQAQVLRSGHGGVLCLAAIVSGSHGAHGYVTIVISGVKSLWSPCHGAMVSVSRCDGHAAMMLVSTLR